MKRGFTLVELLIVATIIALLSGIGIASYSSLSKQSRNSRRKADLENIRSALEFYRSDNSYYPVDLNTLDTAGYLNSVPDDPKSDQDYVYCPVESGGNNVNYNLYAALEDGSVTVVTSCVADCGTLDCNYTLTPLGEE